MNDPIWLDEQLVRKAAQPVLPPISMIVLAPSAEDVAAYYKTLLAGAQSLSLDAALALTQVWLKGQMDAVVERVRQSEVRGA